MKTEDESLASLKERGISAVSLKLAHESLPRSVHGVRH